MTPSPFRHAGLKVLSVVFGVMLWMVVAGEETVVRGLRIPLELQQFPTGLELESEPPSTVEVRVRGSSGALGRLSSTDIVAVIDLRGVHAGRRLFPLMPEQVRAPFGVEIVQVTPPTVVLVFELSATKQVPVVPTLEGRPAAGFLVGKVTAEPTTVEVVGPESAVKQATEALTEQISVAGATGLVRETVKVGMADAALRLKTSRPVVVDVQILPAPVERTVHSLPLRLKNLSANLTARSNPVTVDVGLRGSREGLNGVRLEDVVAYIDLAGLGAGEYSLPVRADAAREAGVTRIDPPLVQVRIALGKN
ncbi:MAG: CdaR family protein [Acidobacteriota bacterium]